jgi:hypothetical protein
MNVFPRLATVLFSVVFFWDGVAIGAGGVTAANLPFTIAPAQNASGEANRKPVAAAPQAEPDSQTGSIKSSPSLRTLLGRLLTAYALVSAVGAGRSLALNGSASSPLPAPAVPPAPTILRASNHNAFSP